MFRLIRIIFSGICQITSHDSYLLTSFFKFELGNKTTISYLSVQQSNYHPLGAVDDPMNCCPRPSASDNSTSGHPQHLGVIVLTVAQNGMK